MLKFVFPVLSVFAGVATVSANAAPATSIPRFSPNSQQAVSSSIAYESEAAVSYQRMLTGAVLPKNYTVSHYSYLFTNSDELQLMLGSFREFKGYVASQVLSLCLAQNRSHKRCEAAATNIMSTYVEVSEGDVASINMASWLYKLDGENWFDYDAARKTTESYLQNDARKLYLIKGWRPDKVLVDKLAERDLPVIVDTKEKTVTIWTNQLDD